MVDEREFDELEKMWASPKESRAPLDVWEPLKGLTPYRGTWSAVVEGPDLRGEEVPPELSDACLEALRALWKGVDIAKHAHNSHIGCGQPGHFHCYRISAHGKGATVWDAWRRQSGSASIWWCSSVREAGCRYSWPNHPAGTFEQLGAALQYAININDEVKTNVVCRKILDWGGVRHRPHAARLDWLDAQTQSRTLIVSIRDAARALRASSTSCLANLFAEQGIPMTSGTTKIFAAAALDFSDGWSAPTQDVLIFDGRVTGALGLLARRVSHALPVAFRFPSSRESQRRRDPSCTHLTFPNLHSRS